MVESHAAAQAACPRELPSLPEFTRRPKFVQAIQCAAESSSAPVATVGGTQNAYMPNGNDYHWTMPVQTYTEPARCHGALQNQPLMGVSKLARSPRIMPRRRNCRSRRDEVRWTDSQRSAIWRWLGPRRHNRLPYFPLCLGPRLALRKHRCLRYSLMLGIVSWGHPAPSRVRRRFKP